MLGITLPVIWTIILIALVILEASTLALTAIWLATGALVALIFSLLGFKLIVQVFVFIIVSIVLLIFTKPIVTKKLKVGIHKTNIDSMIGEHGVVIKQIGKLETGQVKVGGQIWTSVSETEEEIAINCNVIILAIEGVKLIVKEI